MADAVRTIEFTASPDGVSPSSPQFAGVQGDHHATRITFALDSALVKSTYKYRIEYIDGAGAFDTTDFIAPDNGKISCTLPEEWTRNGGSAIVRAVVVELDNGKENQIVYSCDARVYYATSETPSAQIVEEFSSGLSPLIQSTNDAKQDALAAAATAHSAADTANTAAGRADSAANKAIAAANNADEAAGNALISAETATRAAEEATGAAATANTAASNANSAAGNANREAANAKAKAEELQQKADNGDFNGAVGEQGPLAIHVGPDEPVNGELAWYDTTPTPGNMVYSVEESDNLFAPSLRGTATGPVAHANDMLDGSRLRRAAIRGVTTQVRTTTGKNLARRGDGVETITNGLRISQFRGGMIVMPSVTLSAGDYVLSFVKLTDKPTTSTSFSAYINGVKDSSKSVVNFNQFETGVATTIMLSVTETSTFWLEAWGNAAGEVIEYQLQLEAGRAATAYEPFVPTSPTPDYPAPISGAAPTVLTMTGKNLLPLALSATQSNGVTVTDNPDGTITLTGTATADTTIQLVRWNNRLHSGTYTLSLLDAAVPGVTVSVYFAGTFDGTSKTFAWTSAPDKIAMIELKIASDTALSGLIIKPQLEVGANKTAYEPYTPVEAWPPALDPLYGDERVADEYDAVTGTLTRRWGRVVLDGTERWSGQADGAAYLLPIPGKYQRYGMDGLVCSHYPTRGLVQPYYGLDNNWGSLRFWVTAEYATLADWQAYLAAQAAAGTPVTVLYELAEPVVTQLDPQTIITPAPVCNLYADAGTVEMVYNRDLTIAYEELKAAIIAIGGKISV